MGSHSKIVSVLQGAKEKGDVTPGPTEKRDGCQWKPGGTGGLWHAEPALSCPAGL